MIRVRLSSGVLDMYGGKEFHLFSLFQQIRSLLFGVVFIRCCSLLVLELLGSFSNDDGKRHLEINICGVVILRLSHRLSISLGLGLVTNAKTGP